jgi:hypothetical protein
MMSRDFVCGSLCFAALPLLYWVRGVDLHWCVMRYNVPPVVSYLPRWLTRAFSLYHFFLVVIASFANAGRIDTLLKLPFLNLPVLLCCDLLLL